MDDSETSLPQTSFSLNMSKKPEEEKASLTIQFIQMLSYSIQSVYQLTTKFLILLHIDSTNIYWATTVSPSLGLFYNCNKSISHNAELIMTLISQTHVSLKIHELA